MRLDRFVQKRLSRSARSVRYLFAERKILREFQLDLEDQGWRLKAVRMDISMLEKRHAQWVAAEERRKNKTAKPAKAAPKKPAQAKPAPKPTPPKTAQAPKTQDFVDPMQGEFW